MSISKKSVKLILTSLFAIIALTIFGLPFLGISLAKAEGTEGEAKKTAVPAFIVLDDEEKKVSQFAGGQGKTPFDHDQHVAKDSCVTCHHTNSKKLTIAMEEEVSKCATCHKDSSTTNEIEGTNEDKKFKGLEAIDSENAFHGKTSLIGCIGCHKEREIKPVGCGDCHSGQDTIEYQYKK